MVLFDKILDDWINLICGVVHALFVQFFSVLFYFNFVATKLETFSTLHVKSLRGLVNYGVIN